MNHSDNRIAHDEFSSAQGADWLRLKGRVCVVTGAGSGIGAAIAGAFSAVGAQVALLDRDMLMMPMLLMSEVTGTRSSLIYTPRVDRYILPADFSPAQ